MSILIYAKKNFTRLPYQFGFIISLIPYSYRPGISNTYKQRKHEKIFLDSASINKKKEFIFSRIKQVASYAYLKIPFYHELYKSAGVNPNLFKEFDDLQKLPVIKKSDLQKVSLEDRSAPRKGRYVVNTGGSSGQPLEFYIEPSSIGHEWAHMHSIWAKLGFKQSDLKISFGGRADIHNVIEYDSARHQLAVDIYSGWPLVADKLYKVFSYYKPKYLHGYPSSIFDFIIWLDINHHPLLPIFREYIKGMFLGSELPSPSIRQQVENLLNCKSVSWYGHTERSVLAYEKEEYNNYSPFLSYGFAEALKNSEGNRLVCSSYYNYASPLIRYDTGDMVEPNIQDGILESFKIKDGREGEFILDKNNNKIFLTGLIFGRHHSLFEEARHIQICQRQPGYAEVLVVPRYNINSQVVSELFDSSNVLIDFTFKVIDEPKRTPSGKVPLLVVPSPIS